MAGLAGRTLGIALATAWLVGVVGADIAITRSGISLVPLFAVAPLIACAVLPWAATAAFAVAAVIAAVLSGWWNANLGAEQYFVRIVDVTLVSGAAAVIAFVRVRREEQHARLVAIAEVAQRAILPTLPPVVGPVAIAARYLSAAEDALVGGDLYDCYYSDRCTRVLVGDVRGKGIEAVEQAARVIRAFRQSAALVPSLPNVAEAMSSYLRPFLDDEEFVTASLVEVSETSLTIVNCGHPPPLLVAASGNVSYLNPPVGLPLGLGESYSAITAPWHPGARLLMYTDGLSEARDERDEFLSPLALAPAISADTVSEALDEVLEAVRDHVPRGQLSDDLAVVLVENRGAPSREDGVRVERGIEAYALGGRLMSSQPTVGSDAEQAGGSRVPRA